MFADKLF